MFNFDYITKEDIKEHNPKWPEIPWQFISNINNSRFNFIKIFKNTIQIKNEKILIVFDDMIADLRSN